MEEYRLRIYESYSTLTTTYERRYHDPKSYDRDSRTFEGYYRKHIDCRNDDRILDVGCGNGSFVYWLQSLGFSKVEGIDLSADQIAVGANLGAKNLVVANHEDFLISRKSSYDLIFCNDLIEHLHKSEALRFLDLAYMSLKVGGKMILGMPNGDSLFACRVAHRDFTHETCFTPNSLAQVLSICGFSQVQILPKGPIVHGVKSFARASVWKLLNLALTGYMYVETGTPGSGVFTSSMFAVARRPA